MRTIKFRGKASRKDKDMWLYGDLIKINDSYHILGKDDMIEDGHHIKQDSDIPTWVDEKTIGQFTGLFDKNGKEIYEGDIVTMFANINKLSDPMLSNAKPKYRLTTIVYDDASFKITFEGKPDGVLNYYSGAMVKNMEVVGNVHDNPELMKGE